MCPWWSSDIQIRFNRPRNSWTSTQMASTHRDGHPRHRHPESTTQQAVAAGRDVPTLSIIERTPRGHRSNTTTVNRHCDLSVLWMLSVSMHRPDTIKRTVVQTNMRWLCYLSILLCCSSYSISIALDLPSPCPRFALSVSRVNGRPRTRSRALGQSDSLTSRARSRASDRPSLRGTPQSRLCRSLRSDRGSGPSQTDSP